MEEEIKGSRYIVSGLTLTDHPDSRNPFAKPADYNEPEYELLFRKYEAGYERISWLNQDIPNRKTDTHSAEK